MEPLGRFPRVLNRLPREHIEGPPRGFLKANPRPHPSPSPRPKSRGAAPQRFLDVGQAEDVAEGLKKKIPRGSLQYNPKGVNWVLKGPPKGLHSP